MTINNRTPYGIGAKARQGGVAVITVLFILVLLTTLSVYMVEQEHLLMRRIGNQRSVDQSWQLAMGSERWVHKVLERDAIESGVDHLGEAWNQLDGAVPVEYGSLTTEVFDLQGRFNLNNLAAGRENEWYLAYRRLLRILSLDEGLADSLLDWLDENAQATGSEGAEDYEYEGLDPPYRAANQYLATLGELRWVRGYSGDVIFKLSPYVTVLPKQDVRINVNTCPELLFQIMTPVPGEINIAMAQTLVIDRGEFGFQEVKDFLTHDAMAGNAQEVATPLVTVSSEFFEVHSRAIFGNVGLWLISGVYREPGGPVVSVYRKRGMI